MFKVIDITPLAKAPSYYFYYFSTFECQNVKLITTTAAASVKTFLSSARTIVTVAKTTRVL